MVDYNEDDYLFSLEIITNLLIFAKQKFLEIYKGFIYINIEK